MKISKFIHIKAPDPSNDGVYFTHRYLFSETEDLKASTIEEHVVKKFIYMQHIKTFEEYVEGRFEYKGDLITIELVTGNEYVAEGSITEFLKVFTEWLDRRKPANNLKINDN